MAEGTFDYFYRDIGQGLAQGIAQGQGLGIAQGQGLGGVWRHLRSVDVTLLADDDNNDNNNNGAGLLGGDSAGGSLGNGGDGGGSLGNVTIVTSPNSRRRYALRVRVPEDAYTGLFPATASGDEWPTPLLSIHLDDFPLLHVSHDPLQVTNDLPP